MTRRIALETAEIVDIVIQTRAAFGLDYALRYVQLSGTHNELLYEVLGRPARQLRHHDLLGFSISGERRRKAKRNRRAP